MRLWPKGGLWRHPDFLKLWSAETISVFGSQFTQLALPLVAVLLLDASAFEVSALFVVEFLPFILFALPAGVWIDRMRRKPILVAADVGRALLLATLPLAYFLDALTLGHLYVVAFLVGIGTVFFDVSYQSYLPSLVDRRSLVDGNSKLEISRSASQLAGPGTAGGLIGTLGAPVAIILDAASFMVSAALLLRIRKEEKVPSADAGAARPSMLAQAREGVGYVLRHRYLRPIVICTGSANFFGSLSGALIVVYAVRELGLSAALLGLAFSLGNAGPLVAAFATNRISSRIGVGPTILWSAVAFSTSGVFIALATRETALALLVASGLVAGFGSVAYNITQLSFRQAITPERMQGRMNAFIRFVVWGTMPVGALLGGALGTWIGLRPAIWVAAVGGLFTFLPILLSPVRSIGPMPEPYEEPVVEELVAPSPMPAPATPDA